MHHSIIKSILLVLIYTSSVTQGNAQLFKKMIDRTTDKIAQKVEDKVVEEISSELANRAVKPIDNLYDEIFRAQYKEKYGEDYDDSNYENSEEKINAMTAMINSMYSNVELPPAYSFEYIMEIEAYDYGSKKATNVKLLINTKNEVFGMEQEDDGSKIMVFDYERDLMTMYDQKEKTAMAIPNVMKMATAMGGKMAQDEMDKVVTIEKMNKTKKILDCQAEGYKSKSDEEESEFYLCNDLPFTWKDSFGKMLEKTAPNFYKNNENLDFNGMLLEAKSKRFSDKKESKWITKRIEDKVFTLDNSEYKLTNRQSNRQ
jgi:hypothetical protein